MDIYERTPHYYETDKMGIVHHSNYIRWFEEARIHHLESVGIRFAELEDSGIVCPVLHVEADYQHMVRFGETVQICTSLDFYNGVRYGYRYEVRNAAGELCCTGKSLHCFLDTAGNIVRLRRERPELHALMLEQLQIDNK